MQQIRSSICVEQVFSYLILFLFHSLSLSLSLSLFFLSLTLCYPSIHLEKNFNNSTSSILEIVDEKKISLFFEQNRQFRYFAKASTLHKTFLECFRENVFQILLTFYGNQETFPRTNSFFLLYVLTHSYGRFIELVFAN